MVIPVDDIFIPNRIIYDVADGNTVLNLQSYAGFKVGISLDLNSLSETGITFTAMQSNDGSSWTSIKLDTDVLEIQNTTGQDHLTLMTDLFYLQNLGLKIDGLTGAATGTITVTLSYK
jgi:hypothetical protein